ncbi:MAG: TlpA family protein disulfide reductase, partial [Anaerolineales bacterium]
ATWPTTTARPRSGSSTRGLTMSNAKRRREQDRKNKRSNTLLVLGGGAGVLVLLFLGSLVIGSGGGARALSPAPTWQATTLEGEQVSGESLKGDVYAVDFFYTWCPKCAAQYPHKATLVNRFSDRDDFRFFSINSDPSESRGTLARYVADHGSTWPYIKDESGLLAKFLADSRPYIVFVDRDGNIAKTIRTVTPASELIAIAQELLDKPSAASAPSQPAGNTTDA